MHLFSSPFVIVCCMAACVYAGIGLEINIGKTKAPESTSEAKTKESVKETQVPQSTSEAKTKESVKEPKVPRELVTGLLTPVFIPFNDDFTINYSVIPDYVKYLAKNDIKGILVGGIPAEGTSLSVAERNKVLKAFVSAAKSYDLHVMVQVGGAPLPDVVELVKEAQEAGADSVLTLADLAFAPTTVEQLVDYVALVAAATPKLSVLYNHYPANTKITISMPDFVTAATKKISNFKGITFTSPDLNEGLAVLKNLGHGQKVYLGAGNTPLAAAAEIGFDSTLGSPNNFAPKLVTGILEAVACGDVKQARALQQKLTKAFDLLTIDGSFVPGMKVAFEMVSGIKVGESRPPIKQLTCEQREKIEAGLKELGLIHE